MGKSGKRIDAFFDSLCWGRPERIPIVTLIYRSRFWCFVFWLCLGSQAAAFSLAGIDLKSRFGERFEAEVEVLVESPDGLSMKLGSEEDYKRMELVRPDILKDLKIQPPIEIRDGKGTFRIFSEKPLFYPSFNLLISATYKGGTLLENYLITVDFQQSLALNVKGPKKKESAPEPEGKKSTDLLEAGESAPLQQTEDVVPVPKEERPAPGQPASEPELKTGGEPLPPTPVPEVAPEIPVEPSRSSPASKPFPEASELALAPAPRVERAQPQPSARPKAEIEPRPRPLVAIPVAPEAPGLREEKRAEGAVSDSAPSKPPEAKMAETEGKSASPSLPLTLGEDGEIYGPVAWGETLYTIVKKLGYDDAEAARVVVGIWLDNPESFIQGNINGIQAGANLRLGNLKNRLETLDRFTAWGYLHSQTEEWGLIRQRRGTGEEPGILSSLVPEVLLPLERIPGLDEVFPLLQEWLKTWEQGEVERHLAGYASGAQSQRDYKKRLFMSHPGARLTAFRPLLIQDMDRLVVTFDQSFTSARLASLGRKELVLAHEGGQWRIGDEKFKVLKFQERADGSELSPLPPIHPEYVEKEEMKFPYVVHVSSHFDLETATRVVNGLREKGLGAYSFPLPVSDSQNIFRVYLGRFPTWSVAVGVAKRLRELNIGSHAIPALLPYALEVGAFDNEKEARRRMEFLRNEKLSPFLLVSADRDFMAPVYRILVGAFVNPEGTARMRGMLTQSGIASAIAKP